MRKSLLSISFSSSFAASRTRNLLSERSRSISNHSCVDLKRFSAEVFPSCFTFQKFFKKNQEIDEFSSLSLCLSPFSIRFARVAKRKKEKLKWIASRRDGGMREHLWKGSKKSTVLGTMRPVFELFLQRRKVCRVYRTNPSRNLSPFRFSSIRNNGSFFFLPLWKRNKTSREQFTIESCRHR